MRVCCFFENSSPLCKTHRDFREEEDDESMEWEREQLRRGGHFKMAAADKERTKQVYKPAPSRLPVTLLS